ncbi:MAG TPA: NAD(P)/FAD-dependent oxidoreductase [Aliidongia sp.]|nr:NAD(P)/FAD-dependent oxidoreductase [Aliidongia sp.]
MPDASSAGPLVPELDAVVIGTGFAGLGMAIKLKQAGIDKFVVFERGAEVGGTWRDNHYPGCACDIPSHLYSFSFEPNPDWTRMYPNQPEIYAYLKRCADKYGIRPYIRFNTEVVEAVYDRAGDFWRVRTGAGDSFTARIVVSGMGGLSRPAYPKIAGLDSFEGKAFHSAEWDHDYDLAGKNVAVIGTGASAIQFVPEVAKQVGKLHLFQRTAPWVVQRLDRPFSERERKLFRWLPGYRWLLRKSIYWRNEFLALGFVVNPNILRKAAGPALKFLEAMVPDPALRAKVTPKYTLGCKRILISNDYYPALARPNVEVVTEGIKEIRAHSVVTEDGVERPVDAIIYGTGFRATDILTPVKVIGRDGVDLNEAWRKGVESYLGITVAGYPNWFMLVGPNTGLGHNSMVFMIEAQIRYVMSCLKLMRRRGARAIDVKPQVQSAFNADIQHRLTGTVWASGCKSWYLDENGKNTTLWPGFTFQYWARTRRVAERDFTLSKTGWPAEMVQAAE